MTLNVDMGGDDLIVNTITLGSTGPGVAGTRVMSGSSSLGTQVTPAAKTTSTTLTAAEILTGIITGNPATTAAYTLPLATAMETALLAIYPGLANNNTFDFYVINIDTTGADAITMTTNTGWTLVGDMTLAGNAVGDQSAGHFRIRRTAANTYTLYRLV